MKKLLLVIIILALFTGCQKKEEPGKEEYMERLSFEGRNFMFNLDFSDGTGFEWYVIYKTPNVEIDKNEIKVIRSDPASTGGEGMYHFEGHVNDDEDGLLILKYARPWEGDGDYQTYQIKSLNGEIKEINDKIEYIYSDFSFIRSVNGGIYFHLPNTWEYEEYENDEERGYAIRPDGMGSYLEIFHVSNIELDTSLLKEEKLIIEEKEYSMYTKEDDENFLFICNEDNNCLRGNDTGYWKEYFPDIIKILNCVNY